MSAINIYQDYTPRELLDKLMCGIAVGDADELHNALIVVCRILEQQERATTRVLADINPDTSNAAVTSGFPSVLSSTSSGK